MNKSFHLTVTTPQRIIYEGNVVSLIVPLETGKMGFLADHAAIIAATITGAILLREPNGASKTIDIKGSGFLEFAHNAANLLCNSITT